MLAEPLFPESGTAKVAMRSGRGGVFVVFVGTAISVGCCKSFDSGAVDSIELK
jgi:hypothetical protein